ncbi:MAG: hypothetical protein FWF99_06080 [Desulfovibrionaceae bacterium]|nr:hypothetical protein [Desulfovibrionaceae bacterium]
MHKIIFLVLILLYAYPAWGAAPETNQPEIPLPSPPALPEKNAWPISGLTENPAWHKTEIIRLYETPPGDNDLERMHLTCLREACNGNPLAMILLAHAYARNLRLDGPLAEFYPPMRHAGYWLDWAERLTNRGWVARRLGDLAQEHDKKIAHYTESAALGDTEAMYRLAVLTDRTDTLTPAALAGHPRAAFLVAAALRNGTPDSPPQPRLAVNYCWLAALGGDSQALQTCSEYFLSGTQNFPKDQRRSCMFALLAVDAAGKDESLARSASLHLKELIRSTRFNRETIWEIRQEAEIFKAIALEARHSRLLREEQAREMVLQELKLELKNVLDILGDTSGEFREEHLRIGGQGPQEESSIVDMDEQAQEASAQDLGRSLAWTGLAGLAALILAGVLPQSSMVERLARFWGGPSLILYAFLVLGLIWPDTGQAGQPAAPQSLRQAEETAKRENALIQSIKNIYMPPKPGFIPPDNEIPLTQSWEDPDWDTPLVQSIYKNPYSYGNNLDNYLPCLLEALQGNPKAMLALSMFYYLWGYVIMDMYPDFPHQMHGSEYWQDWAEKLTNPGWVRLGLGHLHRRWPASAEDYYRQSAELGNAEGMFHYYQLHGERKHYLYLSASLGYARAAFTLGEELELQGGIENMLLARRFTWLSALNGDEWGLLRASIAFYNNEFGYEFNNCEMGYLYALLSQRYKQSYGYPEPPTDKVCLFNRTQTNILESRADLWQVWQEQRRLPQILRGRNQRLRLLEELQEDLAPLAQILQERLAEEDQAEKDGLPENPSSNRWGTWVSRIRLPWHLGFYHENIVVENPFPSYQDLHRNHPKYIKQRSMELNARQTRMLYMLIGAILSGSLLLHLYLIRGKKK